MSQDEALDDLLDEALRLRELDSGWDGGDAPSPNGQAFDALVDLLGLLRLRGVGLARAKVRPDVEGGLGLVLGHLQVTCDNEGAWLGTWTVGVGEPTIVRVCEDPVVLESFVDWVERLP